MTEFFEILITYHFHATVSAERMSLIKKFCKKNIDILCFVIFPSAEVKKKNFYFYLTVAYVMGITENNV